MKSSAYEIQYSYIDSPNSIILVHFKSMLCTVVQLSLSGYKHLLKLSSKLLKTPNLQKFVLLGSSSNMVAILVIDKSVKFLIAKAMHVLPSYSSSRFVFCV